MLEITIPGYKKLQLAHLVLDYNGTLARDGQLLPGVKERLNTLSTQLEIHVITADTFGNVQAALAGVATECFILPPDSQDVGKLKYIEKLGPEVTVCVGNGRNDRLMLAEAALGIAVLQEEGAAGQALMAAQVVAADICAALDLLLHPLRLAATLRS
ncbi:MAG: ATPase P [Anaerolineae bacterium]|nr:ATPase P [Anaerolineae bacterium]